MAHFNLNNYIENSLRFDAWTAFTRMKIRIRRERKLARVSGERLAETGRLRESSLPKTVKRQSKKRSRRTRSSGAARRREKRKRYVEEETRFSSLMDALKASRSFAVASPPKILLRVPKVRKAVRETQGVVVEERCRRCGQFCELTRAGPFKTQVKCGGTTVPQFDYLLDGAVVKGRQLERWTLNYIDAPVIKGRSLFRDIPVSIAGYSWFITMKDRNRLMHATNGNINYRSLFLGTLRWMFQAVSGDVSKEYELTVDLDDDTTVRMKAWIEGEPSKIPEINKLELKDFGPSLTLEEIRHLVVECDCGEPHEGSEKWKWRAFKQLHDDKTYLYKILESKRTAPEVSVIMFPYLCKKYFFNITYGVMASDSSTARPGSLGPAFKYSDMTAYAQFKMLGYEEKHPGPCEHSQEELDVLKPVFWRPEYRNGGNRCLLCWPTARHEINPDMIDAFDELDVVDYITARQILKWVFYLRMRVEKQGWKGEDVTITACSGQRVLTAHPVAGTFGLALYPDVFRRPSLEWKFAAAPTPVNDRSIAVYRILATHAFPAGTKCYIVNAEYLSDQSIGPEMFIEETLLPQCVDAKPYGFRASQCLLRSGTVDFFDWSMHPWLSLSGLYGIDELIFRNVQEIHLMKGKTITPYVRSLLKFPVPRWDDSLTIFSFIDDSQHRLFGFNVIAPKISELLEVLYTVVETPGDVPFSLEGEGRFIETEVGDYGRPYRDFKDGLLGQISPSRVLVYVAAGTTGDVVPPQAIFRWLARRGFFVYFIRGNTEEEGREMLKAAEEDRATSHIGIWAEITLGASSTGFTTFAPYYFGGADIAISIEPPRWAIDYPNHGLGPLMGEVFRYVMGRGPVMRIGSWGDLDSVPRSTDGVHFDVYTPGGERPIEALFCPGNTSEKFMIPEGAVMIEPGDHLAQMRKAKLCYVTGAGTAQSAAAAGCRVIAMSKKIDRAFKNPTNAGAGMVFETPPERVLSHLILLGGPYHSLFKGLSLYGKLHVVLLWFSRSLLKLMFWGLIVFYVMINADKYFILGPGVPATILMTILGSKDIAWYWFFIFPWATSAAGRLIETIGWSKYYFILWVMGGIFDQLNSPVFFILSYYFQLEWVVAILLSAFLNYSLKFLFNAAIAGAARQKETDAYVYGRLFWYGPFPLFHTAFISADESTIIEGSFIDENAIGASYKKVIRKTTQWDKDNMSVKIRTSVQWDDLVAERVPTLPYELWWNCQSVTLYLSKRAPQRMAAAYLFLLPVLLFTLGFSMVIWVLSFFAGVLLSIIMTLLIAMQSEQAAMTLAKPYQVCVLWLSSLLQPSVPLLTRALVLMMRLRIVAGVGQPSADVEETIRKTINRLDLDREEAYPVVRQVLNTIPLGRAIPDFALRGYLDYVFGLPKPSVEEDIPTLPTLSAILSQKKVTYEVYHLIETFDYEEPNLEALRDAGIPGKEAAVLLTYIQLIDQTSMEERDDSLRPHVEDMMADYFYGEVDDEARFKNLNDYVMVERDSLEDRISRYLFFNVEEPPSGEVDVNQEIEKTVLTGAAEILATLTIEGFDYEAALETTCLELAGYTHVEQEPNQGLDNAIQMFRDYLHVRSMLRPYFEEPAQWYANVRRVLNERGVVISAPIEFVLSLSQRVIGDVVTTGTFLIEPLIELYGYQTPNSPERITLALAFTSILDILDPRHRMSLKPAWALLLDKPQYRMKRGDAMFASLSYTIYKRPKDYEEWSAKMIEYMRGVPDVDVTVLTTKAPTRALRFPRETYGIAEHEALIDHFETRIHETKRETRMLLNALKMGGSEAVDQAWLSTPEKIDVSLSRYLVDRPRYSVEGKSKIIEAADSLFEDFPEMYDRPRAMTAKSVINATVWKYSAGLPFLPAIKKRQQLRNSSWINAIEKASDRIINSGEFPGMAFHAFPKNQLVALDKIKQGKPIRTVTAEDRITAICYNMLAGELNKRPPPSRALVLPSFRRTEGGMKPVLEALKEQPHLFTGDATQFDSTASSSLVVEGPVRLWERGVSGMWGDRATTSWMRAYYEAMADGIIISLLDGKEYRKTGGGGTGSAPTSSNNRDWVRIAFRAAWSGVTGRPCSDFKNHVVLANASDDVVFSCDTETKERLEEIKTLMYIWYGVSFDFQYQSRYDGILHLEECKPDLEMYSRVGLPVAEVPLRHSRERLFTMRSEYRADRMKYSELVAADHIATRCLGHAYLTAHDREAYSIIADDWEDAVANYLLQFFEQVEFEVEIDDRGIKVGSTVVITGSDPSKKLVRLADKLHPSQRKSWLEKQAAHARRWRKAHRLPSYLEIFRAWVSHIPRDGDTAVARRYRHLPILPVASPMIDVLRLGILTADNALSMIPRSLANIGGESDVYHLAMPFTQSEFIIESYIFMKFLQREKRRPLYSEFVAQTRVSPFGSAVDPKAFLAWVNSPQGAEVLNPTDESRDKIAFSTFMVLVVYTISDWLLMMVARTRYIGTLIIFMFFITQRIDVIYSLISLSYWLGEGTASLAISNLTARDPYLILKIFSLLVVQSLGLKTWCRIPGFWWAMNQLSWPAKFLTAAQQLKVVVPAHTARRLVEKLDKSTWIEEAQEVWRSLGRRQWPLLTGGVGLGKSTSFIATLLDNPLIRRVFLVVPTNALLEDYDNAFLDPAWIYKARKGGGLDEIGPRGVTVITAGHFAQLLKHYAYPQELDGERDQDKLYLDRFDIVVIDEAGESTLEQCIIYSYLARNPHTGGWPVTRGVVMTATPDGPLCEVTMNWHLDKKSTPRFNREILTYPDSSTLVHVGVESILQWALNEAPLDFNRALIVTLSIADADKIKDSLSKQGVECHSLSSVNPHVFPRGCISATTIVDVGMDIKPPVSLLVDCGTSLLHIPSTVSISDVHGVNYPALNKLLARKKYYHTVPVFTSASQHRQRCGRVARTANGTVYTQAGAGTRDHPGPFWDPLTFLNLTVETQEILAKAFPHIRALITFQPDKPPPFCYIKNDSKKRSGDTDVAFHVRLEVAYLLSLQYHGTEAARRKIISGEYLEDQTFIKYQGMFPSYDLKLDQDLLSPSALRKIGLAFEPYKIVMNPILVWNVLEQEFCLF